MVDASVNAADISVSARSGRMTVVDSSGDSIDSSSADISDAYAGAAGNSEGDVSGSSDDYGA